MRGAERRVLRWDHDLDPNEGDVEFRLTYDGPLMASQDGNTLRKRSHHVHDIRQKFHRQLKPLWKEHPVMKQITANGSSLDVYTPSSAASPSLNLTFEREGFRFLPIVTTDNGQIGRLDILMLRIGQPGQVIYDIDNRLKTLFDALRMPKGKQELGENTTEGRRLPQGDEDPFFVLLEDDRLITHLAVTSDTLLENAPEENVKLVISVTIKPYRVFAETAGFA